MIAVSVLTILIALGAVLLVGAFICCRMAFAVPDQTGHDPRELLDGEQYQALEAQSSALITAAMEIPCEWVSIRAGDGFPLYARLYRAKAEDAPAAILFHGYQSMALRDFSGGMQLLKELGYHVLLVDQRGHGRSRRAYGNYLTFGVKEKEDCLAWVRYALETFGAQTPIVLTGISMGAATVLLAGGEALPSQVKGIISDSGYSSAEQIIKKVLAERHYPRNVVYPLLALGARLYAGFRLSDGEVSDALKRCRVPVLFIHGEDDRFVPCEMSRENYEACTAKKTILTVPGAGHGLSYMIDREAYTDAIQRFLCENLTR